MKEHKAKVKLVELVKQDRISLKLALADSEGGGGVAVSRQIMPAIGVVCNNVELLCLVRFQPGRVALLNAKGR